MKTILFTFFVLSFLFTSKILAQNTVVTENKRDTTNLQKQDLQKQFDDFLKKQLSKNDSTFNKELENEEEKNKKPVSQNNSAFDNALKKAEEKNEKQDKKELCEKLGLIYMMYPNGDFLGCF